MKSEDYSNYRGIALGRTFGKMYIILKNRLTTKQNKKNSRGNSERIQKTKEGKVTRFSFLKISEKNNKSRNMPALQIWGKRSMV